MKHLVSILVAVLTFCSLSAQDLTVPVAVRQLQKLMVTRMPIHDADEHITLTDARIHVSVPDLEVDFVTDKGYPINTSEDYYLQYLIDHFDLTPLVDNYYSLSIRATSTRNKVTSKGTTSVVATFDIRQILDHMPPTLELQAKTYLYNYVQTFLPTLPRTTGQGEQIINYSYSPLRQLFTITLQYEDSLWGEVKQYITDNYEQVRLNRALTLTLDTATQLAYAAYASNTTLHHVFHNRSANDTVVLDITPWMWEHLLRSATNPHQQLISLVQSTQQACPIALDSVTTLISCTYDAATRTLTYTSQVTEKIMSAMSAAQQQHLREMHRATLFSSANAALLYLLRSTASSVVYAYRSQTAAPILITFTPEELEE